MCGNIILMMIVSGVLVFATLQAINAYTRHGENIALPSLKGLSVYEAAQILRAKGLEVQVSDSTYSPGKPADCVLAQNPDPGELVKEGRTIYLTINSLSVPMQNVPDIIGKASVRQATADMISAGFKLTEDERTDGNYDWIYGIKLNGRSLAPGERAPVGATLTLVVGNGYHSQPIASDSSLINRNDSEDNPMDDNEDDVEPSQNEKPVDKNAATPPTDKKEKNKDNSWF